MYTTFKENTNTLAPQVRTFKNDYYLPKSFVDNAGEIMGTKRSIASMLIANLCDDNEVIKNTIAGDVFEIAFSNYFKVLGKKLSTNEISLISIQKVSYARNFM